MKRSAGYLFLLFALAACSKQEPPPAAGSVPAAAAPAAAPVREDGGSLTPDQGKSPRPAAPPAPVPAASEALLKQGEDIFQNTCATCHMADGAGVPNMQPSIIGSAWVSAKDPQLLLSLILRGSAILGDAAKAYENDMAPQDHLTDPEIAAVATYVRQHFAATPITVPVIPAEVATARARPGLPQ